MNEEIIVILDNKERLYDYCENTEQLYDKFYLPLVNYVNWLQKQNAELKEENERLKNIERSLIFIKNRARQGMTQENINKCAVDFVNSYLKEVE